MQLLINNFYNQLVMRDNHMSKFIDISIDEYLKGDLNADFTQYVYDDISNISLAVSELNRLIDDDADKFIKKSFDNLIVFYSKFHTKWLTCLKDQSGKKIEYTSMFHTLVWKRMNDLNFDQLVSERFNLLYPSARKRQKQMSESLTT